MNESATRQSLSKRLLAAFFAVVLVVGLVPISAWADGDEEQNSATQEQAEGAQEQADDQAGSENVSGGGESPDGDNQDSDSGDLTGSGSASEEGETSGSDNNDGQEVSDSDNDGQDSLADQEGNEVSLASLDGDVNTVAAESTEVMQYDTSLSDSSIYRFLWSKWTSVNGNYMLDGDKYLDENAGDNTFEPKKHGVCTYTVKGTDWPEQLPSPAVWKTFGTLVLQEKVSVDGIQDVAYDGKEHALAPTVKGANGRELTLGVDYTLTYSTTKNYTDAGSKITVSIDFQGDFSDESYYPTVTKAYTIQKADIEVDVKGKSKTTTYNGQEQSFAGFEVTGVDGDAADFYDAEKNVALAEGVQAEGTDAGTYKMNLTAGSFDNKDDNFNVTFNVVEDGSLTIDPADVTVSVKGNSETTTYNGLKQSVEGFEVTGVESEAKNYFSNDSVELKEPGSAKAEGTNAGTCKMNLTGDSFTCTDKNFNVVKYEVTDGELIINQAKVTVTADSASKTYGEGDPEFSATVDGMVNDESSSLIEYVVSRSNTDENVGTYEEVVVPAGEASQGNYSVTFVPADFTIDQAKATVVANPASKIYGDDDPSFTARVDGLVNGDSEDVINYTFSRANTDENVGTYEEVIVPTGETSQGNYSVEYVPGDFTIAKRAIKVNDSATFEYNGQEQVLNIDAAKAVNLADGDRLYLNNAQVKGTEPGTYTDVTEYTWEVLNAELGDGSNVTANYDLKVSGELTITPAADNDSAADEADDGNDSADDAEDSFATPQTGDSSVPFAVGAAFAAALATFLASRKLRGTARR